MIHHTELPPDISLVILLVTGCHLSRGGQLGSVPLDIGQCCGELPYSFLFLSTKTARHKNTVGSHFNLPLTGT